MEKVTRTVKEVFYEWWKAVVIVILSATLVFFNARSNGRTQDRLKSVAVETHTALCTLHDDLEQRLESTLEYLDKHPGHEPIPGITRATLRTSVRNQRATLDALSNLNC